MKQLALTILMFGSLTALGAAPIPMVFDETLSVQEFGPRNLSGYLDKSAEPEAPTRFIENFREQYDAKVTDMDKRRFLIQTMNEAYEAVGSISIDEFVKDHQEKLQVVPTKVANYGVTGHSIFYQLKLQNQGPEQEVVLKFHGFLRDFRVLIDRGSTVERIDTGRTYPFHTLPFDDYIKGIAIPIKIGANESLSVFVKVSTFGVPTGMTVKLFSARSYTKAVYKQYAIAAFFLGTLLSLTLYNLFVFATTRDRVYLFYSMYLLGTIQLGINIEGLGPLFFPNHYYLFYGPYHASFSIWWTLVSLLLFSMSYLNSKLHAPKLNIGLQIFLGISILSFLSLLLAPIEFIIKLVVGLMAIVVLSLFVMAIRLAIKKVREAWFYVVAFSFLIFSILLSSLATQGIIDRAANDHLVLIGTLCQVILLSLGTGDKIRSLAFELGVVNEKLKEYIRNVENLVEMKTKNIRSILKHIRAGIFTIDENVRIEQDFSAALGEIIGIETDFAGKDPIEIVFEKSNLSKEDLGRLKAGLYSAIGEEHYIWQINNSCFPKEMAMEVEGQNRILELSYDPIVHEEVVQQIVVTIRDVTKARAKNAEDEATFEGIRLMHQVSKISESDYHEFRVDFDERLEDAKQAWGQEVHKQKSVDRIFIHLHTLKAYARLLDLRFLSGKFHAAEEWCSEIKLDISKWNMEQFQQHLGEIYNAMERYDEIFFEKLKRSRTPSVRLSEAKVAPSIESLEDAEWLNYLGDDRISEVMKGVFEHFYKDSEAFLIELISDGVQVAEELGKKRPLILVKGAEVRISRQGCSLLRDIMNHLIGNSLDHGIETADERLRLGKEPRGKITVELVDDGEQLKIYFFDDGSGLNLNAIRDISLSKGLISGDHSLSLEEIANQIFAPGFSTKKNISEISGRGVGMDAVKTILEQQGGGVTILLASAPNSHGHYPCRFEIRFPRKLYRNLSLPFAA